MSAGMEGGRRVNRRPPSPIAGAAPAAPENAAKRSLSSMICYLAVLNFQAEDQALVPYTLIAAARQ